MQDHAEEVDGCGADGLRGEEVVGLRGYAGADGGGLRGEDAGAVGDCVGEVLDDEAELGECGCEGDGGAAGGAADLKGLAHALVTIPLNFRRVDSGFYGWIVVVENALTSTTTASASKLSQS